MRVGNTTRKLGHIVANVRIYVIITLAMARKAHIGWAGTQGSLVEGSHPPALHCTAPALRAPPGATP